MEDEDTQVPKPKKQIVGKDPNPTTTFNLPTISNPLTLADTVGLMTSKEYTERFKAEYFQLKIRIESLSALLKQYKNNALTFTPKCSQKLLNGQLNSMRLYMSHLIEQAKIENIEL